MILWEDKLLLFGMGRLVCLSEVCMRKILKDNVDEIIQSLNQDRVVVLVTSTVYGLMARATQENEIKINQIKERDFDKKITVIFPCKDTLISYLKPLNRDFFQLLCDKLPGPYTFLVRLQTFSNFTRDDFGVHITTNQYLQDIISKVGPLLASSCNLKGHQPCQTLEEIEMFFSDKDIDVVVDQPLIGNPSTIISLLDGIKVIRE